MSEKLIEALKVGVVFILHVIATITVVYFLFTWAHAIPTYNPNKIIDPVSIANTFMVFVTFIVVVATVAISIGAVFYTKQYSIAKERLLSENLDDVIKALTKKDKIRTELIEKLLKDPMIRSEIDKRIDNFGVNINEKIKNSNNKIEAYSSKNDELKKSILKEISALKIMLSSEAVDDKVAGEAIKNMFQTLGEKGVEDDKA